MTLELWVAFVVLVLFALLLARVTIYQTQYCRIEDVELFVRPLNLEDFERATDPAWEWSMRKSISRRDFKVLKRQQTRLSAEHLSRMAHNAEIIQGWSHMERAALTGERAESEADERLRLMREISDTATDIRICTSVARLRVGLWLALRADLLPLWLMPPLHNVRTAAGADILTRYHHLTHLTKAVSRFYGPDSRERICTLL